MKTWQDREATLSKDEVRQALVDFIAAKTGITLDLTKASLSISTAGEEGEDPGARISQTGEITEI